jgi:hypothetical protein
VDLAIKAPPASSELPEIAVTGASSAHEASSDGYSNPGNHAAISDIWRGMEQIQRNERRQKELDQIRSRLLGHKESVGSGLTGNEQADLEAELKVISALAHDRIPADDGPHIDPVSHRKEASNAAERAYETDRDRVLARIEQALKNVSKLRSALTSDTDAAYDKMLSLPATVSDLNLARTRLNDEDFGLRSASVTVDAVMLHMRAAVVAHGKMSPELIRLVLN